MFFNSIKEINRLRKEINGLLRKRKSNIYLKVTIEKKLVTFARLRFFKFKNLSPYQFLGSSISRKYH